MLLLVIIKNYPVKSEDLTNEAVQKFKNDHAGILPKLKSYCHGPEKKHESLSREA